jgi:hypothetical protein
LPICFFRGLNKDLAAFPAKGSRGISVPSRLAATAIKKTLGPFAMRVRDFFVAYLLPVIARRSWNAIYAYKIDW